MHTTSISLLERLGDRADQDAWARFVRLYTPLMLHWARQCGAQPDDAADLVQDVLSALVQKLPEFRYEPGKSFRAWLRTVTLNKWRDRLRWLQARPLPQGDELPATAVPDGLAELAENEYRTHLVGAALRIMQRDFEPLTWQAFWQFAIEERCANEVAAELGLSPAKVYGAKFRVLNRLRQELHGLLD